MTAAAVLVELERLGAQVDLVDAKLTVRPARLVPAALREALRATAPALVALLRERDRDRMPSAAADVTNSPRFPQCPLPVACELRRFPDWRADTVVRFCCEPAHRHEDSIPTYDSRECDDLLAFAALKELRRLPVAIRDALLDLKAGFGGRIVGDLGKPFELSRPTGS